MRRLTTLLALSAASLLAMSACFGGGGKPEASVTGFVDAINDADFNDAYAALSPACQDEVPLEEFQETYGIALLAMGVGRGGALGATSLKAEDIMVTRTGDREAEIIVDWVLHSSIESPLPLFGTVADERVPLDTVLDVAGTADRPLYVLDMSGGGDWRLEDCDPLGLRALYEQQRELYEELEYYYNQQGY
jgi:hypothetical protein